MSSESSLAGAAPALERRLATILSADVAGYSKMMGTNEEATVQALRGHRAVFDALLRQHRGRVFNTAGDAILAEFPSAVDAVRCATEIQTALQTRNEHLPAEQKLQFRMGINLGDVVVQDDGDLLGDGVNVASRIQTVAEPGGVCISGSVFDQIQNKLTLQFRPLGEQQFKNIGQPVRTFTITHGERAALPYSSHRMPAKLLAIAAACLLAVGAGGYGLYRLNESKHSEQEAFSAQIAADKAAVEEARKAAEAQSRRALEAESRAERERVAAEAARREVALQAQLQASEEARRRAEADRKRVEDERQRADADRKRLDEARQQAEADKRAAEARLDADRRAADQARADADKKLAMAAPARPAANDSSTQPSGARSIATGSSGKFDGAYNGTMCNFPDNPQRKVCWPVRLNIQNGAASANWPSRIAGKRSGGEVTVTADARVAMTLSGWNLNDGNPLPGALSGRIADDRIDLQGRWANGAPIDGHWMRVP